MGPWAKENWLRSGRRLGLPTWNTRLRAGTAGKRFDGQGAATHSHLPVTSLMLFAYIDTALGSMLLQAMAGMIFAAMVMGRRILAAPLAWMSSKDSIEESDSETLE